MTAVSGDVTWGLWYVEASGLREICSSNSNLIFKCLHCEPSDFYGLRTFAVQRHLKYKSGSLFSLLGAVKLTLTLPLTLHV